MALTSGVGLLAELGRSKSDPQCRRLRDKAWVVEFVRFKQTTPYPRAAWGCCVSTRRRDSRPVQFLRSTRVVLEEFRKTLEPMFPIADMLIVRGLLIYLLLEKAWRMAH